MASLKASVPRVCWLVALASCGDVKNFSGSVPPLATLDIAVQGTVPVGAHLRVGVVWGQQWLPEPLCFLPPPSGSAAQVIADGCRDPFGFVPAEDDANGSAAVGATTTLALEDLPDASLLVGDVTARVGYASIVAYDDRNGDGTLDLARANRIIPGGPMGMGSDGGDGGDGGSSLPTATPDVVLGATFVTMTAPDTRLAYREGAFVPIAFYPRQGCSDPPPGFSVLGAGGFTPAAAEAAVAAGTLPEEPPAQCSEAAPPQPLAFTVDVTDAPAQALAEVACTERTADSSVRYREPEADPPHLDGRETACVPVPTLGSAGSGSATVELIVTGVVDTGSGSDAPPPDSCKGLTHYILKGCRESPDCAEPDWDHSEAPPAWWPCD